MRVAAATSAAVLGVALVTSTVPKKKVTICSDRKRLIVTQGGTLRSVLSRYGVLWFWGERRDHLQGEKDPSTAKNGGGGSVCQHWTKLDAMQVLFRTVLLTSKKRWVESRRLRVPSISFALLHRRYLRRFSRLWKEHRRERLRPRWWWQMAALWLQELPWP